ncbi:3-dehydroquinate dehydratase [Salsuginibacillus halophilus]|uniref:3-dehydroquinate dehydratase n=1 Tax=Salsuginibacillus halophilus TaxID=517424 RepID=A0A2P8H9Q1_9BACI|nr:type I 3-dehydroquinate dehydratase [Salsuginibacillus halophilus]PSL42966.1 3-dehydroquinate dehydratase [Salsuginibacillus halophilus]
MVRLQVRQAELAPFAMNICTSIVGRTKAEVLNQVKALVAEKPDVLEWRADFYEDLKASEQVKALAGEIREAAGEIPVIFTIRSEREGGEPIQLQEAEKVALIETLAATGALDIFDYELSGGKAHIETVKAAVQAYGAKLLLSFHDFDKTPEPDVLQTILSDCEAYGADIGKVAVMPHTSRDVLQVHEVTLAAVENARIPLITIAMGRLGAPTRITGASFGSALTFAAGEQSSAPGQVPLGLMQGVQQVLGDDAGRLS